MLLGLERDKGMKTKALLLAEQLTFSVKNKTLIQPMDFWANSAEFTAIIGPNGAGKTTLFNMLNGDIKPDNGQIEFQQQSLRTIEKLELARKRAVLPQLGIVPFSVTAYDVVALGREPYRYHIAQQHDQAVIEQCLSYFQLEQFSSHYYASLSGGEQHRIQLARVLAQIIESPTASLQNKILFLDEPTNHLDIRHQYGLMETLKQLQVKGLSIIAVMHDLTLTLAFADQIFLLKEGKKQGCFNATELAKNGALSKAYDINMRIILDGNQQQRYLVIPEI